MPQRRVVIYVELTDLTRLKRWWLVIEKGEVDLCVDDPGHEVDVTIYCDQLTLTQIYIGDLSVSRARSMDKIKVLGRSELVRSMPRWFARSKFAADNPLPVIETQNSSAFATTRRA